MGVIIGLTGYARAGKSTAAKHLVENHGFTELSFAKALKDMAYAVNPIVDDSDSCACCVDEWEGKRLREVVDKLGWERAKDFYPEVRGFLQRLGTEGVRGHLGDRAWVDVVSDQVYRLWHTPGFNQRVVIADVRFENEADFIRHEGGRVVRIKRTNQKAAGSAHASEVPVQADEVITNFDGDTASMKADFDALVEAMND